VYANILRYRELVNLAELNLKTHERIYGQIKLKSDSGIGRQSDLSQITARLAKAHANHFAAINNLQDAESNYKNIVGEMPPKDLIYPVPDRDLLPQDLDSAINESLKKNPAIEGARWDVAATESSQKIADADNYPTINFVLERTWNNNLDGAEGPSEDLLAMVRLNYNLYSGGTHKRRKEVATQQNLQASEIRRNTMRDTELTVRLAWAAFEATTGQKEHIRQYVIATKESQIAYEKQFRLGRRTLLDVLDSENELFQARQDYVNADYDELFSEFRLFNAKGELMRAFRIYRPQLLGFSDEFDKAKAPPASKPTATDELKTAESSVKDSPDVLSPKASQTDTEKAQESELFLDANGSSGNW
jgi:adhesin transport system outer membrane protein